MLLCLGVATHRLKLFNKTIAGRRRTLLLNVKPARMSVKSLQNSSSCSSLSACIEIPLRNKSIPLTSCLLVYQQVLTQPRCVEVYGMAQRFTAALSNPRVTIRDTFQPCKLGFVQGKGRWSIIEPFWDTREVPRSADYEYEYVWVSRILTRWLSVPRRTYWQNEYEYNVVGRVKLAAPRPLRVPRPLSRTLRVCRLTAVVHEYTLRLSSRHFLTAVKLIRKVGR